MQPVEGQEDSKATTSAGGSYRGQPLAVSAQHSDSKRASAEVLREQHRRTEAVDHSPMSVLIVDDSMPTRRFLIGVLENSREFEVIGQANDGNEAIEQAGLLQPDLVLLDVVMPNMSGANALARMLEVSPHSIVVILSGSHQAAASLKDDGARAFIPKGIRPYELLQRLSAIVGRPFRFDGPDGWDEMERKNLLAASALPAPVIIRGRAIVYDPDPLVRTLITRVLHGSGVVAIAETNTPAILLTAVDLAKPDFVVLDLTAGGHPDTATLTEIRRRSPASIIIVYSKLDEWRDSALAAGATAFVFKPRIDELADRICHLSPGNR